MGHGCYYTNKETETKSFWIELDYYPDGTDYEPDPFLWEDTLEDLSEILENIGYIKESASEFYNGLYDLYLESGHGGEIVFRLEPQCDFDHRIYNLAMANHDRNYDFIAKQLISHGYSLRMATSGYTSGEYIPQDLLTQKQ